jgi:hypothetical protein
MPASAKFIGLMHEQTSISRHAQLYVNGPAVPEPVSAQEMRDFNETEETRSDGKAKTLSEASDFSGYKELIEEKPRMVGTVNSSWHSESYGPRRNHPQTTTEVDAEMEVDKIIPTNHSTILMGGPETQRGLLVKRVLAYDLPIGRADSFDRNATEFDGGVFWGKLRRMADWLEPGSDPYYETGTLDVPPPPQGLDLETREVVQADIQCAREAYGSA